MGRFTLCWQRMEEGRALESHGHLSNFIVRLTMTQMKPAFQLICTLATVLALSSVSLAQSTLESRLMPLIEAHKGDVAVMVKHLETGETFAHRENEPQATASLIKFPVMIEAYRQSVEQGLDLAQPVTLQEADKVQGSGILTTHFSAGSTFPLKDAIRLMIAFSDNTATNLVLDKIGLPSTAATMEKLELSQHEDPRQGLPPRDLNLSRAEPAVRPGKHDGRRDDPSLRVACTRKNSSAPRRAARCWPT